MATVPKTVGVVATSPSVTARAISPATRVASTATAQVDALNEGTNISFDAAASSFQEEFSPSTYEREGGGRRDRAIQPAFDRLFTADSEVFAKILEDGSADANSGEGDTSSGRRAETTVATIIKTYETNALIISGNQPVRGTSHSFTL